MVSTLPNLSNLSIEAGEIPHTIYVDDDTYHQLDRISRAADIYLQNKYEQHPQTIENEIISFENATVLISYACERIRSPRLFETQPLPTNVKEALRHINLVSLSIGACEIPHTLAIDEDTSH